QKISRREAKREENLSTVTALLQKATTEETVPPLPLQDQSGANLPMVPSWPVILRISHRLNRASGTAAAAAAAAAAADRHSNASAPELSDESRT
ncbi:hypothetical protein STEG23_015663, partial [Scotinomys teguina]